MSVNQQQAEHWNGAESSHWVEHADRYDRQLAPFADALLEQVQSSDVDRVLDIGCGCGVTTITVAQHALRATGVDLSRPMLNVARQRAADAGRTNVDFVVADAQTHHFEAGSFDIVISRFGVMFFDDPVAAFTNVRRSLAVGGRVAFVSWQGLEANEWLLVPGLAAAQHVALPDLAGDGGPGMFSLSKPDSISELLARAGFRNVQIDPLGPTITLGGGGTVDESLDYLLGTGIARALLDSAEPEARIRAIDAVRAALTEHYEPGIGVRLGTGAWLTTATN
jgi:SAM-dependent methyltransferase